MPLDSWLRPAPGYAVPTYFWAYITRSDLFPGGWLHDVGLPLTPVLTAQVTKQGVTRTVQIQAFERAVLSYDPLNPAEWQVERANIGADYLPLIARPAGLQIPEAGARVLLPVHLLARFGQAGQAVSARLRWAGGTTLTNQYTLLPGEDGTGLLIGNLDWVNALAPPEPPTQAATLEIVDASGAVLFHRSLTVVNPHDPGTQTIQLYWTISGSPDLVQPQQRVILATPRVATAALEELLWGPPAISQIGFGTALPLPAAVLQYLGRTPDWGPRVTLRGVTIVDGAATADFSRELNAYGGGSARVRLITAQITQTLRQFPTVHSVRLAIEGQVLDGLQP